MGFEQRYLVSTDEMRIMQILLNLQSNALKFTPKGGSVTILVTHLLSPSPSLRIDVIDTGCGIKEVDQSKLFKLYGFLTATQEVNAKGIGLGLYICKKLANKLDGDITIKSEWKHGSTFSLILPLTEVSDEV